MKLAYILFATSFFWLLNCKSLEQKNEKSLSSVISYLNQGKDFVGLNLTLEYQKELLTLEKTWGHAMDDLEKHRFFHEKINRLNMKEFEKVAKMAPDYEALAKKVYNQVESHSSAKIANTFSYQDADQIGFCFGRALLAHYYLLKAGVPQKNIVKIFALGDLVLSGQFWRYHVAAAIKNKNSLLVIDPLYGEVVDIKDWVTNIASLEIKHPLSRARFFVTDARQFMPHSGSYDLKNMLQPELKPYFSDLFKNL